MHFRAYLHGISHFGGGAAFVMLSPTKLLGTSPLRPPSPGFGAHAYTISLEGSQVSETAKPFPRTYIFQHLQPLDIRVFSVRDWSRKLAMGLTSLRAKHCAWRHIGGGL